MVFTTPDYFPFLVRKFHQDTQWDECNSYAALCRTSQAILDFPIPYGLSVSTGRSVSNSLSSQLVFSMVPSRASSIGYLAASRPLFVFPAATTVAPPLKESDSNMDKDDNDTFGFATARGQLANDAYTSQSVLQGIRSGVWKCNWENTGASSKRNIGYKGEYLMMAQMYPSLATMTGTYVLRRSENTELTVSGASRAGIQPDLQLIVQQAINNRRWSCEGMIGTSGRMIGVRGLYNFGQDQKTPTLSLLSVGGEVFVGAQEISGGVSLGARYRNDYPLLSELTCVLNPIMGHLTLAWAQQMRPQMCAAVKYDFNVFSLVSDLAVGLEWQLDRNSMVKTRWSGSQGLRFLVDTRVNNMVFSMGVAVNGNSTIVGEDPSVRATASGKDVLLTGGARHFIRSFGLQLQWFL